MMGFAAFLIEAEGDRPLLHRLRSLSLVLLKNPIFVALLIGIAMKTLGIAPGGPVKALLDAFSVGRPRPAPSWPSGPA